MIRPRMSPGETGRDLVHAWPRGVHVKAYFFIGGFFDEEDK